MEPTVISFNSSSKKTNNAASYGYQRPSSASASSVSQADRSPRMRVQMKKAKAATARKKSA
jgi:hypothetical protein